MQEYNGTAVSARANEGGLESDPRPLHILITANSAWNIWNFRKPIARDLIADGHSVTVLSPFDESVPWLEGMGCSVEPLAMSPGSLSPANGAMLLINLRKAFRRLRPDTVLGFTIKNNIFGAIAAKSLGIPFVPNVTGLGTAFLSGKALEIAAVLLYRAAFSKLPVVFFENEDDCELFVEKGIVSSDQARVLPGCGVDLNHFAMKGLPHTTPNLRFLMISRLLRDKGVIEFVDAARMIKSTSPGAQFQILGALGADNASAIDAGTLQAWVKEGAVEYLGKTQDVRPHIASAHCVVLPSYREGAPRALIEAAAMGRPVIATDVPGCRAVVERGVSGFLCEARSAESLAAAMRRFIDLNHDERAAMGRAGRMLMERQFDEAFIVAAYRNVISTLTGKA